MDIQRSDYLDKHFVLNKFWKKKTEESNVRVSEKYNVLNEGSDFVTSTSIDRKQ